MSRLIDNMALAFGALALLAAMIGGMYNLELQHFRANIRGTVWVNWIGEFQCGPDVTVYRPKTLEEMQTYVTRHKSVRAAATGHSFNFFSCPEHAHGAVVDMKHFTRVQVIKTEDAESGYAVEAEAGAKMGHLQNEILARWLTLRVPPGNPAYTVGGCIATGCHNLGQSHAQDLLALKLMLHNGTVREVRRGEPDFQAAAVSLGMLGIIVNVTLEVLPYRTLQWSTEQLETPPTTGIIDILENMTKSVTSRENVGNKLVFYLATKVLMFEHWIPMGRAATPKDRPRPLPSYVNSQPFRVGQGGFTQGCQAVRDLAFQLTPKPLLTLLQMPAEAAFRGLHSSATFAGVRQLLGWQHSPEARGEGSTRPKGHQYTWAGWLDEVTNLLMGLRHVEVIFPLEPKAQAVKCLDVVFAHRHLAWWRLNVRTQRSEGYHLSSTHSPPDAKPVVFLRVDFVAPGGLLDKSTGEASLTAQLARECPGWRKHWGKGLFATSAEQRWGDPKAFLEVAARWDPDSKFRPQSAPSWLQGR